MRLGWVGGARVPCSWARRRKGCCRSWETVGRSAGLPFKHWVGVRGEMGEDWGMRGEG